jgi:hypothetical protein
MMGVCWRSRFQLLRSAEVQQAPPIDEKFNVSGALEKINAQFIFFISLTLGGTTISSKATLTFDESQLEEMEFDDPNAPSDDELFEIGTQLTADAFTEADAASLNFVHHTPAVDCFVQRRADGKVAALFSVSSTEPWYNNLDEHRQSVHVEDPSAPPNEHHPEGGWRPARQYIGESIATPAWVRETETRTVEEFDEPDMPHDVLSVDWTWTFERHPGWGALVGTIARSLPENSDFFNGFEGVTVLEMQNVLRRHLDWV